jgi:hypothetical protein
MENCLGFLLEVKNSASPLDVCIKIFSDFYIEKKLKDLSLELVDL